jgi:hypothetical protein
MCAAPFAIFVNDLSLGHREYSVHTQGGEEVLSSEAYLDAAESSEGSPGVWIFYPGDKVMWGANLYNVKGEGCPPEDRNADSVVSR